MVKNKKFGGSVFWLVFWILIFFPIAIGYYLSKSSGDSWFHKHYILTSIGVILILFFLLGFLPEVEVSDTNPSQYELTKPTALEFQIDEEFDEVLYLETSELFDRYDEQYGLKLTKEIVLQEAEEADALQDEIARRIGDKYHQIQKSKYYLQK